MKKLLWMGIIVVGFGLLTQQSKAQDPAIKSQWVKVCSYDKLRNKHNSGMIISSKKSETYGSLNNSVSDIIINDFPQKDAGPNCTKPNYNVVHIMVEGFDVLPCKNPSNICTITIKFNDEPIQSFTPIYLESISKTDNSSYVLTSPLLLHEFETHRSAIIEIPTSEGAAQYEFDLRNFDHPQVINTVE
ncbi:hypothetical protein COMNV_00488 [Commensalibacter sp. Nvir]|uniref:hypothetical protein n=1 Tax=Commensalibacter sp. Nvir TaxID=3069817 RepID=UPI002D3C8408|nr:hypothetical protein COMNV_00488 [Commensalibacter sp. Nvir]